MEQPEVTQADREAIEAANSVQEEFVAELNTFHVKAGAFSYTQIVQAAGPGRLSRAGVAEMLGGKRLPSVDALMAFVRAVNELSGAPAAQQRTEADRLRARWTDVKLLQRRAVAPWKRVRQSADTVLEAAKVEAERILADAQHAALQFTENAELLRYSLRRRVDLAYEAWRAPDDVSDDVSVRELREVVPVITRLYGPDDPDTLRAVAYQIYCEDLSWQRFADQVDHIATVLGASDRLTLHLRRLLSYRLPDKEAHEQFDSLLPEMERVFGDKAYDTLSMRYRHAAGLVNLGFEKKARRAIASLLADAKAANVQALPGRDGRLLSHVISLMA